MNKEKGSELLTLVETADKLKVSIGTLRRWDNDGHLKAVRIGTRRGVGDRRYRNEDIEDYIRKLKENKSKL